MVSQIHSIHLLEDSCVALVSTFGDKNKSLQDCSPRRYFGILKEIYCLPKILCKREN